MNSRTLTETSIVPSFDLRGGFRNPFPIRYRTGRVVLVELLLPDREGFFQVDYVHLFALHCGYFPEEREIGVVEFYVR